MTEDSDNAGFGATDEVSSRPGTGLLAEVEGRDILVIAFGGIHNELAGMAPFEFLGLLADQPVDKIFIRDAHQSWHHEGVVGLTDNIWETAGELRRWTAAHERKRVITLGTSAGGFAALLFGSMLNVDCALAFGPQTFVGRWLRLVHRDHRWRRQIGAMYRAVPRSDQAFDLRKQLRSGDATTRYEIHVGGQSRLDLRHAGRIEALPGVEVHVHRGGHTFAKDLRDSGELLTIIEGILRPESDEP